MGSSLRCSVLGACLCSGLLAAFATLPVRGSAQQTAEVRVVAVVDYVAGLDIYLTVGTDGGVRPSDTLRVYDGEGSAAELLGRISILSATATRSVGNLHGDRFALERGDTLYLGVPAERLARASASDSLPPRGVAARQAGAEVEAGVPPVREEQPERPAGPTAIHGRVSLDFEALRSTTRWGEGPDEELERSFNTPTLRLQARARHLPGGLELSTGMRLAHRTSPESVVQPETSARIYELDLEKRFETLPLEMHLGRFYNRFEELSGYWDGLLVRVGPESLGAGVAVGYEPERANEGFSSDRPKLSGFVDFSVRRQALAYDGSVSFLGIRPSDALPDRTALGISQSLRVGGLWIHQRLQVDQDPEGSGWSVTRLQMDGSLPLQGGLGTFAGWRRWRSFPLWEGGTALGPRIDSGYAGLSWFGGVGGASLEVSLQRPQEGDSGRTFSGSAFLNRTLLRGIRLGGHASHWSGGDDSSLLLSPEIRTSVGTVEFRGAYRFYATSAVVEEITTHSGDLGLTLPLGAGAFLRLQGTGRWGGGLSSTRLFASVWKAF